MIAAAYATESMRLTTRLMRLASWLLLQRSVNEGEMTLEQALQFTQSGSLEIKRVRARRVGGGDGIRTHGLFDATEAL